MRSDFETWLVHTYGYKPDETPMDAAAEADSPEQFLTKDGTFDMKGYEDWVERKRKEYQPLDR